MSCTQRRSVLGDSLRSQSSSLSAGPVPAVPCGFVGPPPRRRLPWFSWFRLRPVGRAPLAHRDQAHVSPRPLAGPAMVPGVSRGPGEPLVPAVSNSVASDHVAPPEGYDRGSNPSSVAGTGDVTARPFRFRAAAARRRCRAPSNEIRRAKRRLRPARCPGRERKTRAARGWGRAMSRPTPGLPEAYPRPTSNGRADGPRNRSPDPRRRLAPDPARRRACPGRRRARRPVRAPPGAWLRASGRVRRRGQRAESDEFSRPGPGLRRTRPRPALPPCARPRPALPPCAGPRRVPCHGQGIRAGPACRAARSRPTDGAGAREMTRFSPTRLENTAKVGLPPGAVHGLGARAGAGLRPNASAPRPGRRHTGTAAIAEAQGDAVAATDMVFV